MAALGYRLGMFRGRGRPSPPPHTLFTPLREVGVGSNGGLCLQLEEVAQKDVREARGSQRREAPRPRQGADEGRRRLARGPEHIRPGLQGARPLRTLVGAGVGGAVRTRVRVSGGADESRRARARHGSRGEVEKARLGSMRCWTPDGKPGWTWLLLIYDLVL